MLKRITLLLTLLCLMIFSFVASIDVTINAKTVVDNQILDGGVFYEHAIVEATKSNGDMNQAYDVFSHTLKGDNEATKVVTWSYTSRYNTTLVTLDKIAEDYEKNHPGWIVVGGVNAEGYHSQNGYNEISNMFVQDYELMRTGVSSESYKELIGFYPDNSHFIKRVPTFTNNLILRLYDEAKNEISKQEVLKYNELPTGNEIALLTCELANSLNVEGYYVINGKYDLYRRNTFYIPGTYPLSNTDDGVLVKGTIEDNFEGTTWLEKYQFALVTKDEDKAQIIKSANNVVCQYEFLDEFKNAHSVTGYMYKLIENGHVMLPTDVEDNTEDFTNGYTTSNDSFTYGCDYYHTLGKQRSAIGFKDDGSIVLLSATNKKGGPSQYGLGTILKGYGCTNAYQFDGGGSVTFIKRNQAGSFTILNEPSDGHARAISTGIFFVTKDPRINFKSRTRNTLTFECLNPDVSNIKAVVNGKNYVLDDTMTIKNLQEDTEYDIFFTYNIKSYLDENKVVKSSTSTKKYQTDCFIFPKVELEIECLSKTSVSLKAKINVDGFDLSANRCVANFNDTLYDFNSYNEVIIDNLIPSAEYQFTVIYSVYDRTVSKNYTKTVEYFVALPTYEIPSIETFEVSRITNDGKILLKCSYDDPDKVVKMAYVECDGNTYILESTYEVITLSGITEDTEAKLILSYLDGDTFKTVESKAINIVANKTPQPAPSKSMCATGATYIIELVSVLSLAVFIIFKKH